MQKSKPTIIWEKWTDPFGQKSEDLDWPGYDDNADSYEEPKANKLEKINAIVTNMGIIPYNEHTDCSKIFNFWIGHTNFDITKEVSDIIELAEGVETLDIFTRYRFRISIGKSFNDREVMDLINRNVNEKLQ